MVVVTHEMGFARDVANHVFLWTVGKLLKKIMPMNSLVAKRRTNQAIFGTNTFGCDL